MTDVPGITVRFFAGAARAMGAREVVVDASDALPLANLVAGLAADGEAARVLALCSWLVDCRHATPRTLVRPGTTVDALPPFAGG